MTKTLSVKEFIDRGYLQEVNRAFLHPLGLALAINPADGTLQVWDSRGDAEGFTFDLVHQPIATIRAFSKKAEMVQQERDKFCRLRETTFGWSVEPIPESKE